MGTRPFQMTTFHFRAAMSTRPTIPEMMASPAAYGRGLLVETDHGSKTYDQILDPWQRDDRDAMIRGWLRAVRGETVSGGPSRAFFERPRGHSKTLDSSVWASWALFAAPRSIRGLWAAGDKDQARLGRDKIDSCCRLNPWLADVLTVNSYNVTNRHTGSRLEIISSDAPTSYGETPDFVLVDEITAWTEAGEALWHSLLSSAAKRGHCVLTVIANAGMGQGVSWQWNLREAIRQDPAWYFSRLNGPQASWITPEQIDEQRRLLPAKAFNRLWLNLWTADIGDCLDSADVEACCTLPGPIPCYMEPYFFCGSLDLGLKNDHSALCILAIGPNRDRFKLASVKSWAPDSITGQVNLMQVEQECFEAAQRYRLHSICYDPWQSELLAQRLVARGVQMVSWPFTARNMNLMATTILSVFKNRTLAMYRDADVIRDLMRLSIVERPSGFKLTATRDKMGHADRAIAIAIGLPWAAILANDLKFYEQHRNHSDVGERILAV
jgi:hypothetical protein